MALTRHRLVLAALAVLGAMGVFAVATGSRAGAQRSTGAADRGLDAELQILGVDGDEREIVLEVAVPPALGRLAPIDRNFGVTDGGQLVAVAVAPLGTAADTVLVLDTSGSMQGPALTAAKGAARSFVEALPDDVRVGLVSFGETVTIHRAPTLDRVGIRADIDDLDTADGETALWDGLVAAADLVGESGGGQSSVVVLSDGEDTVSTATRSEAVDRLRSSSAVLYAVAIESPDTDLASLEATVRQVGGQLVTATDIGELGSLYTDIAGRLANRYQLRFAPARQGTRTVVVSVAADGAVATARITLSGSAAVDAGDGERPASVLNVDDRPVLGVVTVPPPGPLPGPIMLRIGVGSVFGAFALVGLLVARPRSQVRLATATSTDRFAGIATRLGQRADRLIAERDRDRRLDARLDAADIDLRPGEFVLLWLLVTSVAGIGASALAGLALGALVVPLSAVGTLWGVSSRASRRRARFADQLTETLGIMASSLRAGQSIPQSVELVASEAPSPTAEQFHRIQFEMRVGRNLTDSMRDVADRMKNQDLEWLAQAIDIHRELGGDLTEILDNVAGTIRERRRVARQIDALSAEGRATSWLLLALPIVVFLFSWWKIPRSAELLLTEPAGRVLLAVAVGGMAVGYLWIRRLLKLTY